MEKFEIVRQQIPLISEHLRFLSLKECDGFIDKYGQILNEFEEKLVSENESVEYAECWLCGEADFVYRSTCSCHS